MSDTLPDSASALARLHELSAQLESQQPWVDRQLRVCADAGILGWVIPEEFGGAALSAVELNGAYQQLSTACLTTAFVLTQRNGACQRIAGSGNVVACRELLPGLARGDQFSTVGISHLTTSRQHLGQPAVQVDETDDGGLIFDGTVPWVTGAAFAKYVVTGGTLDDGRQVLAVVDTDDPGVRVQLPVRLLALNESQTASIELERVTVPREMILAGPIENVMKSGTGGGTGSVTTSALATGLSSQAIRGLFEESIKRPDLRAVATSLESERDDLSEAMRQSLLGSENALSAQTIREKANSLALRSTQAYLAACKGRGFTHGHPAERMVREAMFFLVWSCPQPVLDAALREFACLTGESLC